MRFFASCIWHSGRLGGDKVSKFNNEAFNVRDKAVSHLLVLLGLDTISYSYGCCIS